MQTGAKGVPRELVLCGWDEVFILDLNQTEDGRPKKVWSWRGIDRPELPEHMKGTLFQSTDECKPVEGGSKILITSSGWGVALVERATRRVLFYAIAENAHSADILPGQRVAVATSFHESEGPPLNPNRLIVFDLKTPEKELYSTELPGGHGVVWDEARQILWALSSSDIRAYRLEDWDSDDPSLEMVVQVDLPEGGGHDLFPVPDGPMLMVTTSSHCWLFDRDTHAFRPHPDIPNANDVKSMCVHPVTGQLAYVQASRTAWWSEEVRLLHPEGRIRFPGQRLYKARWCTAGAE
jgi:hypothetical protein